MKKFLALTLAVLMIASVLPMSVFASVFDASVTGDYFTVISEDKYNLAPGATEIEMVVNNAQGNDRKVVHIFEVDTKNENLEVMPGYYGIDKLDPDNLALDGVTDKKEFWKAEQLTKTVAYYEGMGYNVVGAMNTALAYDSDAPYGYMVWQGVKLGGPEIHKGASTYLAIDREGNCELRSMSTPLDGSEYTAIPANFGWLVKDGVLQTKTVERTSSDASRSMIGIKADGTLVFCQVDGRNAPFSTGLSNYEMGEMMLAIGCVNAVNCDGGGSSTFVSKREGETVNTMRSVPSDGSERATINSVILVSTAKATGEFDHAVLDSEYDYVAPGATAAITAVGVDAAGSPAALPEEGITWAVVGDATLENGVFTAGDTKGDAKVQMLYNGEVVGEKVLHVVDPDVFAFTLDETVLPYGKEMTIDFACTYGADDWAVSVEGAYALTLSDTSAATLNGNVLTAPNDEAIKGVVVTATYLPNPAVVDTLKVDYGKGSEIVYDFEDGDVSMFLGVDEMYDWAAEVGAPAPIQSNGNYSSNADSATFLSTASEGGIVRNGEYALGVTLDYTDAEFASWSYNMFFHTADPIVLRDVANGKAATTFGMWVYIPEGAAGLAMQIQGFSNPNGTGGTGAHFYFTTASGAKKNLNSCTEADIPESRWVYATCDLTSFGDFFATYDPMGTNGREPSFIRFYIKPTVAANLTFYFDDFTLDYSSAVEDRVLPTISDVSYTTADESVALSNGAKINGNNIAFSAVVSDNVKLDNATGKIYVDGVALDSAAVSGKYLASETVTLASGTHTVTFEIKDTLGNPAKATRTFTINGDAYVTIGGHNDSGEMPEYGSVYYVDVNAADITSVNNVNVDLYLQTGNTWEPEGISVADGFKVDYAVDEVKGIISLNIERTGDEIDANATTLVSVPVRLWVWDGVDHVTDTPITPEAQFKTGYCPVVTIDCRVVKGDADIAGVNALGAFGGSISVATKINDTVYPWHYHDADLTVLDKAATCTATGYTGRTYCETCKSVIDWGTVVEALGHNFVSGVCTECGKENKVTGLVEENGNWYYYVNGKAVTGWQMIGADWYYFDETTAIGADGDVVMYDGVNFVFENGRLTEGAWAKMLFGMRYYYGPNYYRSRDGLWVTIDGNEYFFDSNGLRLEGGYQLLAENQINLNWYYFDENGVCDKSVVLPDGFYTDRNGLAYSKDGKGLIGEQIIDGNYYFFSYVGYAQKNGTYAGRLYMDDYAAFTGILNDNGTLRYYKNGKPNMAGMIEIDGDIYFAKGNGELATGSYYVWQGNGILPENTYVFGNDGKLLTGIVERDGNYYYYRNGRPEMAGLVKVDGYYYFAKDADGLCVTGNYFVWKNDTDLVLKDNNCEFGADGKLLDGIIERDGNYYYYNNGRPEMAGLVNVKGDYYFAKGADGLCVTGKYFVWKNNTTLVLKDSNCEFGEDGKMLNGIVERDGNYYYYNNGRPEMAGLVKVNGDYYFAKDASGLCVTGKYFVWKNDTDLVLTNSNCEFGADGKMLNGIVERDGNHYYYNNGRPEMAGVVNVDGYYYFAKDADGLCVTGKYYVWKGNGLLREDTYEFGADGKMLDGLVEIDGNYYYYNMGKTKMAGLIEVNGAYYFVKNADGLCATGKYFVWQGNGILPEDTYEFGPDGMMYNGFVTKDGSIYCYNNGKVPTVGINYIDGYYYFVGYDGKLVVNTKYYVWATNGYTLPDTYTFDGFGRATR